MNAPTSLVGKVFKARYYPNVSFLEAGMGYNPSFIWRSIHSSQPLLKVGCRIRIGLGLQTNVWRDPWIDDEINSYVETDTVQGLENLTVAALKCTNYNEWDIDLITDIFSNRDQEIFLSIPLFTSQAEDVWMWKWDARGSYTVKSGYRYLVSLIQPLMAPAITNWSCVRALHISPKISNFLASYI